MTINERIGVLIKEFKLNPNSFSNKVGVSSTVIHNILKKRNNPGFDLIQKILFSFDNINSDWLLVERGEMLKESKPKAVISSDDIKVFQDWHVKKDAVMSILKSSVKDFDKSYEYLINLDLELAIALDNLEIFYMWIENIIENFSDKNLSQLDRASLSKENQSLIAPIVNTALFYTDVLSVLKDANDKFRYEYRHYYDELMKRKNKNDLSGKHKLL